MESRLRPHVEKQNTITMKFSTGEKVEAVWSSDGQKYPGTIVHVFPNDSYEVLFDDGVKSRRKSNQIYKLKERAVRAAPSRFLKSVSKPPPLTAAKAVVKQESVSAGNLPPPPPLKCVSAPSTPSNKISRLNNEEQKSSSPTSRNQLSNSIVSKENPKKSANLNKSNSRLSVQKDKESGETPEKDSKEGIAVGSSVSENGIETPTDTSEEVNSVIQSTKKGFVYVREPHYSVFDIPATDLGKRQRRVHNYSQLARGPSLKKGTAVNGNDDVPESASRSNSPTVTKLSSSVSVTTPAVAVPVPSAPQPHPSGNKPYSSTFTSSTPTSSATPTQPFTRKRRFLKSPSKEIVNESSPFQRTVNEIKDKDITLPSKPTPEKVNHETPKVEPPSPKPKPNGDLKNSSSTEKRGYSSRNSTAPSNQASNVVKESVETETFAVPSIPTPVPSPTKSVKPDISDTEEIPAKRLRKPALKKFSDEEGYIDIFSSRRRSRPSSPETRSRKITTRSSAPTTPNATSTIPTPTSPEAKPNKRHRKTISSVTFDDESIEPVAEKEVAAVIVSESDKTPASEDIGSEIGIDTFDDDEELLDVGGYSVISPTRKSPSKKSPKKSSTSSSSPAPSTNAVCVDNESQEPTSQKEKALDNEFKSDPLVKQSLVPKRSSRTRSSRLWKWQSSKSIIREPSVVLNRLETPAQVQVNNCDSDVSDTAKLSGAQELTVPLEISNEKTCELSSADSSASNLNHRKSDDNQQTISSSMKTRQRGLLPGLKAGTSLKTSLSKQLIKRSKLHRRIDKRGRPRIELLSGITKKKLKRIQESISRRKPMSMKLNVASKFKDVRVDIINCICGRTDEFGLNIQCEVCLCWQHATCFQISDGCVPRFYVCQSCASPKSVRPSRVTEGIRLEVYKKGVLPVFPTSRRASPHKEKVLKRCYDLSKMLSGVTDAIYQNKIKQYIAEVEPPHPKLYQWSAPRSNPKDVIQKWYFNKYFKSVLRRLLRRNKATLPDYIDKLTSLVGFRETLKRYTTTFDEAKLAIGRKIGPRGLGILEKLADNQMKLLKIQEAKAELDRQLSTLPEIVKKALIPGYKTSRHIFTEADYAENLEEAKKELAKILEDNPEFLCDEDYILKSDESEVSEVEEETENDENLSATAAESFDGPLEVTYNTYTSEQLKKANIPTLEDLKDEWVEAKKTGSNQNDLIKVSVPKRPKLDDHPLDDISFESDSETTLSGETTVSVEDSEGGEDFWYHPITELNKEYSSVRKFLLKDPVQETVDQDDVLWKMDDTKILKRDWEDNLKKDLVEEYKLEWEVSEEESSSDESDTSVEEESQDEAVCDDEEVPATEAEEVACERHKKELLAFDPDYWRTVLSEDIDDTNDDEDPTWDIEDASSEESNSSDSEQDEEYASNVTDVTYPNNVKDTPTKESPGKTSGVILATLDPTVKSGEVVNVFTKVDSLTSEPESESEMAYLGKGVVTVGIKGQCAVKLLKDSSSVPSDKTENKHDFVDPKTNVFPLCKMCQDTLGVKWTWDQFVINKSLQFQLHDAFDDLVEEYKWLTHLGKINSQFNLKIVLDYRKLGVTGAHMNKNPPASEQSQFQPRKLTEICRDVLSQSRGNITSGVKRQTSGSDSLNSTVNNSRYGRTAPPTSAEEESILSLLTLSKTPIQFNGENVGEVSIESLRKLTDRLHHAGSLSESISKVVQPSTSNGLVGMKASPPVLDTSSKAFTNVCCVRCQQKHKTRQVLTVFQTSIPDVDTEEHRQIYQELSKGIRTSIRNCRAISYVLKRELVNSIYEMVERKMAERLVKELGLKVSPDVVRRRNALEKPEKYLTNIKSQYCSALMPYATHFISRFTKKDKMEEAKKNWIMDMLGNYSNTQRALKDIYEVTSEDERHQAETKFYAALDNLRKSFDIVLTKKDIKMRRQTHHSQSDASEPSKSESVTGDSGHQGVTPASNQPENVTPTPESVSSLLNTADPLDTQNSNIQSSNCDETSAVAVTTEDSSITTAAPEPLITTASASESNFCVSTSTPNEAELASPSFTNLTSLNQGTNNVSSNEVKKSDDQTSENTNENGTSDANQSDDSKSMESVPEVKPSENEVLNSVEVGKSPSGLEESQELEILNRLANYPMKDEDVNALLAMTEQNGSAELPSNPKGNEVAKTSSQEVAAEMEVDLNILEENLGLKENLVIDGDLDLINTIGHIETGELKGAVDSELLLNVFDDPIFQETPIPEPVPCSSKSITNPSTQPKIPVLAKLTPEMCRGYLIDDIRAHQSYIDTQLDKIEAEIIELERRRGCGIREKDDPKLFHMLSTNLRILVENMNILERLANETVGDDVVEVPEAQLPPKDYPESLDSDESDLLQDIDEDESKDLEDSSSDTPIDVDFIDEINDCDTGSK